jgi:hypothetical protein
MECPHCRVVIATYLDGAYLYGSSPNEPEMNFAVYSNTCPSCHRWIIYSKFIGGPDKLGGRPASLSTEELEKHHDIFMIYPRNKKPRQLSKDNIPDHFIKDYEEASAVLIDSAKASAALSRRLLEKLLDNRGFKQKYLSDKIESAINSNTLPPYLASSIDVVRNVGNFAAHTIKSTATDQIQDVEPGEAEWNLHVLERLLDFYFVQPADDKRRLDALNKKLVESGRSPVKTSGLEPSSNPPS